MTKFKGPGMEKPVIRPYTPTSATGTSDVADLHRGRRAECALTC